MERRQGRVSEPQPLERDSFAALLARLHAERYTGALVLHFGQGVAHHAEIPNAPRRIALDKRKRKPDT